MKLIFLSQNKIAFVDDEDYERANAFCWSAKKGTSTFYGKRGILYYGENRKRHTLTIKLHRFILGITDPKIEVDHVDGNGQNNVRSNLRACSHQQNSYNRPPKPKYRYKGVYPSRNKIKFYAHIQIEGKNVSLGVFDTEKDAAGAYDQAAIVHYGEFARLNFPQQSDIAG